MNQEIALDQFRRLLPVTPSNLIGLWQGRGIASGHPLDGVLENLGWFGKRFTPQLRADALLFRSAQRHLIAIDPSPIPLGLALRFHRMGRTRAAQNLFSHLQRVLRAQGPTAAVTMSTFDGVSSAAMVYDRKPITDHFRQFDKDRMMGAMVIVGDPRLYFFELRRVAETTARDPRGDLANTR